MVRGRMGKRGKKKITVQGKDGEAAKPAGSPPSGESTHDGEDSPGKIVSLPLDETHETEEEQRSQRELELLDKYQRLMAEFDNFRKRVRRDAADHDRVIRGRLLLKILPVLDDYDRAQKLPSNEEIKEETKDREALLTILRRLAEILEREGLEPMETAAGDGFDPEFHEAIGALPSEEIPAQHVLDIFELGYRFEKKPLRPARVMVSTGPAAVRLEEESRDKGEACDPEEISPDGTNRPDPDE